MFHDGYEDTPFEEIAVSFPVLIEMLVKSAIELQEIIDKSN